jgi:hypothetical protein
MERTGTSRSGPSWREAGPDIAAVGRPQLDDAVAQRRVGSSVPSVWNRGCPIRGVRFERSRAGYFALPAPSFVFVCFGFLGFFAFLSIVILQGCPLVAAILARLRRSVQPRLVFDGDSSIRAPGANPRLTDDRPGSAPEGT